MSAQRAMPEQDVIDIALAATARLRKQTMKSGIVVFMETFPIFSVDGMVRMLYIVD